MWGWGKLPVWNWTDASSRTWTNSVIPHLGTFFKKKYKWRQKKTKEKKWSPTPKMFLDVFCVFSPYFEAKKISPKKISPSTQREPYCTTPAKIEGRKYPKFILYYLGWDDLCNNSQLNTVLDPNRQHFFSIYRQNPSRKKFPKKPQINRQNPKKPSKTWNPQKP